MCITIHKVYYIIYTQKCKKYILYSLTGNHKTHTLTNQVPRRLSPTFPIFIVLLHSYPKINTVKFTTSLILSLILDFYKWNQVYILCPVWTFVNIMFIGFIGLWCIYTIFDWPVHNLIVYPFFCWWMSISLSSFPSLFCFFVFQSQRSCYKYLILVS